MKSNTDAAKETKELTVKAIPGTSLSLEGNKNGESMGTYKTSRTTTTAGGVFEMTLDTDMTLNSNSMVLEFLTKHYPYGSFNRRHNKLHVVVDKNNWNLLAPKFKVDAHLEKMEQRLLTLFLTLTPVHTNSNWLLLISSLDGEFLSLLLMLQLTIRLVVAWLLMPIYLEDFILKLSVVTIPKVEEISVYLQRKVVSKCSNLRFLLR